MTKSSTMRKARLPIIRSLSDYAYKVGEISFPPEWIPEGDYNSVVKEIKERMKDLLKGRLSEKMKRVMQRD